MALKYVLTSRRTWVMLGLLGKKGRRKKRWLGELKDGPLDEWRNVSKRKGNEVNISAQEFRLIPTCLSNLVSQSIYFALLGSYTENSLVFCSPLKEFGSYLAVHVYSPWVVVCASLHVSCIFGKQFDKYGNLKKNREPE